MNKSSPQNYFPARMGTTLTNTQRGVTSTNYLDGERSASSKRMERGRRALRGWREVGELYLTASSTANSNKMLKFEFWELYLGSEGV